MTAFSQGMAKRPYNGGLPATVVRRQTQYKRKMAASRIGVVRILSQPAIAKAREHHVQHQDIDKRGSAGEQALAGRPAHVASAQDMEMKMKHALAAMSTGIDYEAVPRIGNPLLFCDCITGQQQAPEQCDIGLLQLGNRGEMFSRDDE